MANGTMPEWAQHVKTGDWLAVSPDYMGRAGEDGEVTYVHENGIGLDFHTDRNGVYGGVPSEEFWEWDELQPPEWLCGYCHGHPTGIAEDCDEHPRCCCDTPERPFFGVCTLTPDEAA